MIEVYFDGVLLDPENYMGFSYTRNMFQDSFYLGSTSSVQASLVIPKGALPSLLNNVLIKINNSNYLNLIVDNIEITDDEEVNLTLVDRFVNLNVSYDISSLVPITAKSLLEQICTDFNISHDTFSFTNDSVSISSYDSNITARDYVSMIAELAGGYCEIDENNKLQIKLYSNSNITQEITTDDIDSYKLGKSIEIERVVYEMGSIHKESSSDTSLNTLYLNSENLFLQNITDNQFTSLCNNIIGFTFYNINIPNCNKFFNHDNFLNLVGLDNITYTILNQFDAEYFGGFVGNYKSEIKNQRLEATQVLSPSQKIKKLQIIVDQENNRITQLIQRTDALEESIEVLQPYVESNLIIISTDASNKPFSSKTYSIPYSCKYLGNSITLAPTTSDTYTGITCVIDSTNSLLKFTVSDSTSITLDENKYTFTWSYTDPTSGDSYTATRVVMINTSSSDIDQTVIISSSAPSDTDVLWYDTTDNVLKSYINDGWQEVNDESQEIERIARITQSNNEAIEGTTTYFLTDDTTFVENKTYYELVEDEYEEYSGPTTGNPHELGLYEKVTTYGLTQKYTALATELATKPSMNEVEEASRTITNSIIQEETFTKLQIRDIVNGTGVDGLTVSSVVSTEATFNKDGMTYEKSGSDTNSIINQSGLKVNKLTRDSGGSVSTTEEVFFAGYVEDNRYGNNYYHDSIVYTHNLLSTGFTEVGKHGRFQEYEGPNGEDGVGFFII